MNLMAKENIFLSDIELPDVVQEKADEAFSIIITEEKGNMKKQSRFGKIIIGAAGMAACATIAIAVSGITGMTERTGQSDAAEEYIAKTVPKQAVTGMEDEENLLSALDKMFTLRVKAAESQEGQQEGMQHGQQMTEEKFVPLEVGRQIPLVSADKANQWVLGGDDETKQVSYCINVPFTCEGDHIEKVMYSINKGAFQIIREGDENIIVDGEVYVEDDRINSLNCGRIGGRYDDETGLSKEPVEMEFYKSFTLDYHKQSDDNTWINIVNVLPDSEEIMKLIWGDDGTDEQMLDMFDKGMKKMLDNTIITCTVWYSDQTSQSVDIKVSSSHMTYAEAGEPEAAPVDPDDETIYVTFELQE